MTINDRQIKFEMWVCAIQCTGLTDCRTQPDKNVTGQYTFSTSSLLVLTLFRALAPMYYRNADAAVLVYDVTDPVSMSQ